jgi:hypothetical protein
VRAARPLLALAAAVLLAFCLSACGGDTSTQTTSPPGHFEGGEERIEGFGTEASGETRAEVLAAFHGYLGAVAARDFSKACGYLAATVKESLQSLLRGRSKPGDCAQMLPELLASSAPALSREQEEGEVKKVRVEGDRGFVVYHAPGAELYQLTMSREGGAWKAEFLGGSVLVPSAATLGVGQ